MAAVVQAIISFFSSWLTTETVKWLAFRALMITLFMVVLPLALMKGFYYILDAYLTYVEQNLPDQSQLDFSSYALQLSGLSAWFAVHLRIPEAASIVAGAVSLRWVLNFVPFIK